jgi:RNA polymerase primary sigma factor
VSDLIIRALKHPRHQPISREEEAELLIRAHQGDARAERRLVDANLKFVVSVARGYTGHGLEMGELVSEGALGLQLAVRHFDKGRDFKLISYAVWWIRQRILKALAEQTGPVTRRPHILDAAKKVEKARRKLEQALGRPPSPEEVAKASGFTLVALDRLAGDTASPISLSAPTSEGDGRVEDMLPGTSEADTEAAQGMQARLLRRLLRDVDPEEAEAFIRTWGLDGEPAETLAEVGDRQGVSRERARQRRNKAKAVAAKRAAGMGVG